MGTIELQGEAPYFLPSLQYAKANVVGDIIRVSLGVLRDGKGVQIELEMLPKTAQSLATALFAEASKMR
jgi:hypothetical protein